MDKMEEKDNSRIYKIEEKKINIKLPKMFQEKLSRREMSNYLENVFSSEISINVYIEMLLNQLLCKKRTCSPEIILKLNMNIFN